LYLFIRRVIKRIVVIIDTSLLLTTYKILSNILLSRLTPYAEEIIQIINVDFDVTGQLLIIYSAFI